MKIKRNIPIKEIFGEDYVSLTFDGNDIENYLFLYKKIISDFELSIFVDKSLFSLVKQTDKNKIVECKEKGIRIDCSCDDPLSLTHRVNVNKKIDLLQIDFLIKSNLPIELIEDNGRIGILANDSLKAFINQVKTDNDAFYQNFFSNKVKKINETSYLLSINCSNSTNLNNKSTDELTFSFALNSAKRLINTYGMISNFKNNENFYSQSLFLGVDNEKLVHSIKIKFDIDNICKYFEINNKQIEKIFVDLLTSSKKSLKNVKYRIGKSSNVYDGTVSTYRYSLFLDVNKLDFSSNEEIEVTIFSDDDSLIDEIRMIEPGLIIIDPLDSISVFSLPDKTVYTINETFDSSGLIVRANYASGASEAITNYTLTIPQFIIGLNTIDVSYFEMGVLKTTSFTIRVTDVLLPYITVFENMYFMDGYPLGTVLNNLSLGILVGYSNHPMDMFYITNFTILNNHPLNDSSNQLTVKFTYDYHDYFETIQLTLNNQIELEDTVLIDVWGTTVEYYYNDGAFSDEYPSNYEIGCDGYYIYSCRIGFNLASVSQQICQQKNIDSISPTNLRLYFEGPVTSIRLLDSYDEIIDDYDLIVLDGNIKYLDIPIDDLPLNNGEIEFLISSLDQYGLTKLDYEYIQLYYSYHKSPQSFTKLNKIRCNSSTTYSENPSVNIGDGSLVYEFTDFSIYKEKFKIVLSHIYNSNNIDLYESRNFSKGKGFKLNIEEFVVLNSSQNSNYIDYYDSKGYVTRFKKAINSSSNSLYFYDEKGLGLRITYPFAYSNKTFYLLEDINGNKKVFNDRGNLIYIVDSHDYIENVFVDGGFAIALEYDEFDRLIRVYNSKLYDNRRGEYINLVYIDNTLGLIEHKKGNVVLRSVHFKYDIARHLVETYKNEIIQDNKATILKYNYLDLLTQIIDVDTKLANLIDYNDNFEVRKLSNCFLDGESIVVKDYVNFKYDFFVDNNIYIPRKTSIVNNSGITFDYYFDKEGKITTFFEKKSINSERLYPEAKLIGKIFGSTPSTNKAINDKAISSSSGQLIKSYNSINIYGEGEEGAKTFTLSFFLKLKNDYSSDTIYAVLFFNDGSLRHFHTRINENAIDSRQAVSINFRITTEEDSTPLTNFKIYLVGSLNSSFSFDYSYFQIQAQPLNLLLFDNEQSLADFEIGVFCDDYYGQHQQSLCFEKNINNTTIKLPFKNAILTLEDLTYSSKLSYLNQQSCFKYISFGNKKYIYENLNDFYLKHNNTYAHLYNNGILFYLKSFSIANDLTTKIHISFLDNLIETTTVYEKTGQQTQSSIYAENFKGDLIFEKDIYGLELRNYYDTYGNIIKIQKNYYSSQSPSVSKYLVLEENCYDNNKEKIVNKEVIKEKNDFEYDSFGNLTKNKSNIYDEANDSYTLNNNYLKIQYDTRGERIVSFAIEDENDIYYQNDISYDKGRISRISNGYENIAIDYDIENEKIIYSYIDLNETKTPLQEISKTINANYSVDRVSVINFGYNSSYIVNTYQDKYGKVLCVNDGNDTNFTYITSFKGLLGSDLIDEVVDYQNTTNIKYYYNDKAQLCRIKTLLSNNSYLDIRQISDAEITYLFGDFLMLKTYFVYDEKLSSRRLSKINYSYAVGNITDTNTIFNLKFPVTSYSYDYFGRIDGESHQLINEQLGCSSVTYGMEYSYKNVSQNELTNDICEIHISYNSYSHYRLKYDYLNNQIRKMTFTDITLNNNTTIFTDLFSHVYSYDSISRITGEVIYNESNSTQIKEISLSYGMDRTISSFGKISSISITENLITNTRNFSYNNKGLLEEISIGNNLYEQTHDKYGNYVIYNEPGATFNIEFFKGNLLKRINTNVCLAEYFYSYNNVRKAKIVSGSNLSINYYYDNDKLLGEKHSDGKYLVYLYDAEGIFGLIYYNNLQVKNYIFGKDIFNNVICIYDDLGNIINFYRYDCLGNCEVLTANFLNDSNQNSIGNINPIRRKSQYRDFETGFYYIDGRYFSTFTSEYLEGKDLEGIERNPSNFFTLSRNGIGSTCCFANAFRHHDFLPVTELKPDPTYSISSGQSWWQQHFLEILILVIQLAISIATLICNPFNPAAYLGFVGVVFGVVSLFVDEKFVAAGHIFSTGLRALFVAAKCFLAATTNILYLGLAAIGLISGLFCCTFGVAEFNEACGFGNFLKKDPLIRDKYNSLRTLVTIIATAVDFLGPKCFKKGTKINTKEGAKNIEDIKVGDEVLSYNQSKNCNEYKKVTRLYRNKTDLWIHLNLNNGVEIICTPQHKFFEKSKGWIESYLLSKFMIIQGNKKEFMITSIKFEKVTDETSYNFEVEDNHTYYVYEDVLTHNGCGAYKLLFKDKNNVYYYYIGKGDEGRMEVSIIRNCKNHSVINILAEHYPAENDFESFLLEAKILRDLGFKVDNFKGPKLNFFNKIHSPGNKFL